ncbi:DUF7124 domain-containing protein [Halorubrum yunnanense]|uniref:DUF7124 domain-containing protein n=1 Tax=Halorubrum yunnanense TaxID=1526162 RepID=UPI003CCDD86D
MIISNVYYILSSARGYGRPDRRQRRRRRSRRLSPRPSGTTASSPTSPPDRAGEHGDTRGRRTINATDRHVYVGTSDEHASVAGAAGWAYRDVVDTAADAEWRLQYEA